MDALKNHHSCKACIVHCMDFRIQSTIDILLTQLGLSLGEFDRVSVAGGAGNFDQLKKHLEISTKLHHPWEIILTVHEDCGYGAKKEDLKQAKKIATDFNLKVRMFFLRLNGSFEELNL